MTDDTQSDVLSPKTADTISRQATIEAIADWRILDGTGFAGYAVYNLAIDDALAVIKAMPDVTVTEDMVERASKVVGQNLYVASNAEVARAVLHAALGE